MPRITPNRRAASRNPKMRLRALRSAALAALVAALFATGPVWAGPKPSQPKPTETPELVEKGKIIYFRRCSFCHGLLGDGEGPAAAYLDPRPRDFTLGTFKFRSTQSGELPTDENLFRTVSLGLAGTAMQGFDDETIKNGLSEADRWAVISYIKTFAPEFANPEFDPYKKIVPLPQNMPPYDQDSIARGKEIFERAKCWECHGKLGRGDGQKSFDRTDDWGFPIRIRNLTHSWRIKSGTSVENIYERFSTGVNGTPMPSFAKALDEDERWSLANYIKSLQHRPTEHQVLNALRIEGRAPDTSDDEIWNRAEPMDVRLAGQVIAAPRWQNPSIDLVTLKAVFNDQEIVFLIEWDDPFQDLVHRDELELETGELRKIGAFSSYVESNDMVPRKLQTFRDAVALQFPAKPSQGTKKPHFLRGTASDPVQLWIWKADSDNEGRQTVEEAIARGWSQPAKPQAADQQQVTAVSVWRQGRWSVVMRRPLATPDRNDVQFAPGTFTPLAVNVWDGSNGEHGLIMSLSSWYYVFLRAPTPWSVYIYTILAFLLSGALGWWLVKKAEEDESPDLPGSLE